MSSAPPSRYAAAGVDLEEAERAKKRIKRFAQSTFNAHVLSGIGSFGAAYSLTGAAPRNPVLISSADGVGTKLKVAFATGIHHTVGQDLVNHCVNDIAVQGAEPLFFLDYLAAGKLDANAAAEVVRGLSKACRENGCALIGGETAEMPGMYQPGEYDLAGFIVGAVSRPKLLDGKKIRAGDALLGLPSTGLHTNGYSLARKLLFETAGYRPGDRVPELGRTAAEELLAIHRSYLKPIRALFDAGLLRGAAHITGGGITGNTPRMLPQGLGARIKRGSWPVLPVFPLLQKLGRVPDEEMFRTFNMGLGMILAVPERSRERALRLLRDTGHEAFIVGAVRKGRRRVTYE